MIAAAIALVAVLPASALARPASKAKDDRPNILVVMTDDMAADDIQLLPNVQKLLAKKGTTYSNAIDNFPLCCPARATFLTGQYAHNHGVVGNFHPYGWYGMKNRENTLGTWLDDAGYETSMIGKWLNGYGAKDAHGEIPAGFDNWRGLLDVSAYDYHNFVMNKDGKLEIWGDPDFAKGLVEFGNIQVIPGPQTAPVDQGQARRGLRPRPLHLLGRAEPEGLHGRRHRRGDAEADQGRQEGEGPVLHLVVGRRAASRGRRDDADEPARPRPEHPPPVRSDDVAGLQLPRPPNFNEADISDKPSSLQNTAPLLTEAQIASLQEDYQGRIGSLLAVDEHVGEMVDTLKKTDQLKNTMIMFVSDNGWQQGEHRITGDKFLPYEASLRVPMILTGPGVKKNQVIEDQVINADFTTTLVDAAGAKAGRTQDGISLLPSALKGKDVPDRVLEIEAPQPLFAGPIPVNAWDRPYAGVRTNQYTYVRWNETGEEELYDRAIDPYQLTNVASDPAFATIKADLAAKLAQLETCKGKSCTNVAP